MIPTPDFPDFHYMLGANLGSLLYGDVSVMQNVKPLAIFCGCVVWFVSDLVGNLKDRFFMTRLIFWHPLLEVHVTETRHGVNYFEKVMH